MLDPNEYRVLTEIAHKLDYAINSAKKLRDPSVGESGKLDPAVLICDEAVSALDVSVQEQVIRLLIDLRNRLGVAILFITHDLRVAAQLCDTVIVMNDGHVVEVGPATDVLTNPQHEYTRYLIDAVPARNWSFRDRVSGQADMDQGR